MLREWFFQVMGQEIGPLSVGELKAKVENGQIQSDSMVRRGADGKWMFAGRIKGLMPVPETPPPVAPKTLKADPVPRAGHSAAPASSDVSPPVTESRTKPILTMPLADDEPETKAPAVEFYDFVGFREAISPALYDAVKLFATEHGLTLTQLNRRALAEFIGRSELACDLMITAIAIIPQPVNDKSHIDGRQPLTDRERIEQATFQFTLYNSSHHAIQISEGVFLPESVEVRHYDSMASGEHPALDHTGHVSVRLESPQANEALRFAVNLTLQPQQAKDLIVWFRAEDKPSFTKVRGQLKLTHGNDEAVSEPFTLLLHGDSPKYEA